MSHKRRDFLKTAGVFAISGGASRILGANDRVNVGVIGIGGRGTAHMKTWAVTPQVRVTALCDVNQAARERGVALIEQATGSKPQEFIDMRKLFESKDVDAVSMATPNHWHALGTIWGCQSGKDVYVEKPASHNVFEGRKMIEAARKYNRMVQVGSQSRSSPHIKKAMQLLSEGVIGKIYMSKGLCYKRRKSIGHTPDQPVPPGVNWDLFLGPAPMRPFSMNRFRYNWHWFWDTGNGDIGNQGIHQMDIARWGLGRDLPTAVVSTGGKYVYNDDQEAPNTQIAALDYGDAELVFEVRGLMTDGEGSLDPPIGITIGNLFWGSDGYMLVAGGGFKVYKGDSRELVMDEKAERSPRGATAQPQPHFLNFIDAVRARDHKLLNAEVEIGVRSAVLVHVANISYRLKRRLEFDPTTWKFRGDQEANQMLTRPYRAPYIVPDNV